MSQSCSRQCCVLAILIALSAATIGRSVLVLGAAPPEPTLESVLQLAGRYVVDYGASAPVLIGTERYEQSIELTATSQTTRRVLVSDYALVRTGNRWIGFRDVQDVDGRSVADRKERLEKLLLEGSASAMSQARELAGQSVQYNVAPIQRNLNTPTMALYFLEPEMQRRFKFKKSGDDHVNGLAVWKIRYEESVRPTIIMTAAGKDMPVKGTFWIDPTDGSIVKSQLTIETEVRIDAPGSAAGRPGGRRGGGRSDSNRGSMQSSASVTVTFTRDARLARLVPLEMRERYETPWADRHGAPQGAARINCRAAYDHVRQLATAAR